MALPTHYPPAAWRPVRNTSGVMVQPTRGLIPHVQQGNGGLYGRFNDAATQVSSHLWVAKTGYVEQYVELDKKAWAQAAGNPYWISVECEGFVQEDYTAAQVEALAALFAWGMAAFGWLPQITDRPDRPGLGTHRMGGADFGGHSCPGDLRASRRVHILARAVAIHEGDDMALTDDDVRRIAAAVWGVPPPAQGVDRPIAKANMGQVVGETYNKAGALQAPILSGLADRVEAIVGEVSRIGDHLGAAGALIAALADIRTEVTAIRTDLAQRSGTGADLKPVLDRLDQLTFTVAPA